MRLIEISTVCYKNTNKFWNSYKSHELSFWNPTSKVIKKICISTKETMSYCDKIAYNNSVRFRS